MMMKFKSLIGLTLGAAAMLFASCDDIAESDRLIEVPPIKASRAILVEEFSGQYCLNCPTGAETLDKIMDTYGADSVIVVSLHAGPKSLIISESEGGLATDFGGQVYEMLNAGDLPFAVFDRKYSHSNYNRFWLPYAAVALQAPTPLDMSVDNSYDDATRTVTVTVTAQSSEEVSGNLNVWLTEDGIVAKQRMPDGEDVEDYVHNHIFRTSATPLAGDAVSVDWDSPLTKTYEIRLDSKWKAENTAVVAFVANADGVCQTTRAAVKK